MNQEKFCAYLKPSLETISLFETYGIKPISETLGFHTTIHYINYHCLLESTKEEFEFVTKTIADVTKTPKPVSYKLENWETPTLVLKNPQEIIDIHSRMGLLFVMSGIFIDNTYANVNPDIYEEEHGSKPVGYTPHISISKETKESSNKIIAFEPKLYSRIKNKNGDWEDEKEFPFSP